MIMGCSQVTLEPESGTKDFTDEELLWHQLVKLRELPRHSKFRGFDLEEPALLLLAIQSRYNIGASYRDELSRILNQSGSKEVKTWNILKLQEQYFMNIM